MCSELDCSKPTRAKGLCQFHYNRSMRHRYKLRQAEYKNASNPSEKTLKAQKEFNDGLWEFVKKELRIQC